VTETHRARRRALLLLPAAVALLGAIAADDATRALKRNLAEAREVVVGHGSRNQRLESLRAVTRDLLDTRAMARSVLGEQLAQQPPAQQEEFYELFDELIVRAYLQRLLFFRRPDFRFVREEQSGDTTTVYTKLLTRKDEFYIDYVLHRDGERWAAVDISVERISLTENYRAQFRSLLRTHSFDELLDRMRRKLRRYIDDNERKSDEDAKDDDG